ncbi:MAG: LytR/AlgR family response regulator transcription factor [Lachnospiraceae bacterium]
MKIAICEDDTRQQNILTAALDSYRTPAGEYIQYDVYPNGLELLASKTIQLYDILLLDILMPGFTGIQTAREIRETNEKIPIIFLTNSQEFAVESYRVHAFDYLMKPIDQKALFKTLDKAYAMTETTLEKSIILQASKAIYVLSLSQIEFVEVSNRTLSFHLIDGTVKSITGRLSDYENTLLSHPEFLKIHRSYLINMDLMKALKQKSFITLTGDEVPISRNLLHIVQKQYIEHLHSAIRK